MDIMIERLRKNIIYCVTKKSFNKVVSVTIKLQDYRIFETIIHQFIISNAILTAACNAIKTYFKPIHNIPFKFVQIIQPTNGQIRLVAPFVAATVSQLREIYVTHQRCEQINLMECLQQQTREIYKSKKSQDCLQVVCCLD